MNGKAIVMKCTEAVSSSPETIMEEIRSFRSGREHMSKEELAEAWASRIVKLYAAQGAATALPGAIPGIGTKTQLAIEVGAESFNIGFMLRCMARMVAGVATIYGHDIRESFTHDFAKVLALWCGVLMPTREAAKHVATKVALAQFKKVPAQVFAKINRKVGTTIITKYGVKRGGIAVGRLIPFGVGSVVGGGFNYSVMRGFKRWTMNYYTDKMQLVMA